MGARSNSLLSLLTVGLLGFLLVAASSASDDGEARLVDLEAKVEDGRVMVSFELEGAFDDAVRQRVASGLPTSFVYEIRLVRPHRLWFDNALRSSSIQVVAMYNALTREYLINTKHDGDLVGSRVVRDPTELETAMTRLEPFSAFSVDELETTRPLVVRARAELGTRTVLSLIPSRRTTAWAESARLGLSPGD